MIFLGTMFVFLFPNPEKLLIHLEPSGGYFEI